MESHCLLVPSIHFFAHRPFDGTKKNIILLGLFLSVVAFTQSVEIRFLVERLVLF